MMISAILNFEYSLILPALFSPILYLEEIIANNCVLTGLAIALVAYHCFPFHYTVTIALYTRVSQIETGMF